MVVHSIHPDVMRPAAYESVMTDYERWTLLYLRKFFTGRASSQYLSIVCAK